MKKQAVIIYGPPGAGKGTQAELLARRFFFIHFDTGKYLEMRIYNPKRKDGPEWQKARKAFETGKLIDPSFILKIIKETAGKIADTSMSIVYSGSPRTMYEAFGEGKEKGLLELLSEKYGKENISIIFLDISEEESLARNSTRKVCSVCGLPILGASKLKVCAFCGGEARVRTLDDPKIIKVRWEEFKKRTYPILEKAREKGFKIYEIDGSPMPYKVHREIEKNLNLSF